METTNYKESLNGNSNIFQSNRDTIEINGGSSFLYLVRYKRETYTKTTYVGCSDGMRNENEADVNIREKVGSNKFKFEFTNVTDLVKKSVKDYNSEVLKDFGELLFKYRGSSVDLGSAKTFVKFKDLPKDLKTISIEVEDNLIKSDEMLALVVLHKGMRGHYIEYVSKLSKNECIDINVYGIVTESEQYDIYPYRFNHPHDEDDNDVFACASWFQENLCTILGEDNVCLDERYDVYDE